MAWLFIAKDVNNHSKITMHLFVHCIQTAALVLMVRIDLVTTFTVHLDALLTFLIVPTANLQYT